MKNRWRKAAATLAVAAPLALSGATPAFADTVGGGTWNWGNSAGWNYSDYFHSVNRHSSTVICGDKTSRAVADAGKWSNAGLWAVSGCGFYWNNAA